MGAATLYTKLMRKLIFILLLLPFVVRGQQNIITIPGKLKINIVPDTVAAGDYLVTIDSSGNIKKIAKYFLTFSNGLSQSGSNVVLGGTLSQNTTISSNGFEFYINQLNPANNIFNFQYNGSTVGFINTFGNMYLSAVGASSNPNDAVITLNPGGVIAARNRADAVPVMRIKNNNIASTGDILELQNVYRSVFTASVQGGIMHAPMVVSNTGSAIAYDMSGGLIPTANNDVLTGLVIRPTFGTSKISTLDSLVGGSGYPNGTFISNLSGGTGKLASISGTVSGGVITGFSLVNAGINYTNGDVLTIVILNSMGVPTGSGGTVTVSGVTSYTGIVKQALLTEGRDVFDQDYSSTSGSLDKMPKSYIDTHISGVSLSTVSQGLQLAPKMTTTQKNAISGPQESWVVYDTTLHAYYFYNGTSWTSL